MSAVSFFGAVLCLCLRAIVSFWLFTFFAWNPNWVDKIQGLCGSRHSYTGPPRGEAGQGNPEAHQLGSGNKSEPRVLLTVESGQQWPSIIPIMTMLHACRHLTLSSPPCSSKTQNAASWAPAAPPLSRWFSLNFHPCVSFFFSLPLTSSDHL